MKIITRAVLDWDGNILEEDSYQYEGPITLGKSSGSAPNPVDPYQQAAAEYGLSTGTADYNAALNRTNNVNPLGSSTWDVTGTDGPGPSSFGGYPLGFGNQNGASAGPGNTGYGEPGAEPGSASFEGPAYGLGGSGVPNTSGGGYTGSGAPIYTNETSLTPWANALESAPIDTSQIPGMPGGPSLEGNVGQAENSVYQQQMDLLAPQEAQQSEQTQAQLEAEGAMPGSDAFNTGERELGQTQGVENAQVANQAVTTGMGELPMLYGLGSTSLQNQLAERMAPISEYEALNGGSGSPVSAATPDISGAFGQQYQGALAGYNAQTASNNATTGAVGSLAGDALLYAMMS